MDKKEEKISQTKRKVEECELPSNKEENRAEIHRDVLKRLHIIQRNYSLII